MSISNKSSNLSKNPFLLLINLINKVTFQNEIGLYNVSFLRVDNTLLIKTLKRDAETYSGGEIPPTHLDYLPSEFIFLLIRLHLVQTGELATLFRSVLDHRNLLSAKAEYQLRKIYPACKPKQVKGRDYVLRDTILRELGFLSYQEYLSSGLWEKIRKNVFRVYPSCYCCGSTANEVHHTSYSHNTLSGKHCGSLISLCKNCHRQAEFSNGKKLPLDKVNRKLKRMRNAKTNYGG